MASLRADCLEESNEEAVHDLDDARTSATVKRYLDTELTKKELMEILVTMETELQAREIAFATLKAEKSEGSLQKFRYGCFSSLHHDSILAADDGGDWEAGMKSLYARQLALLDNLVQTQHKTQNKTRMQLASLERQYHKVCAELEKERQKTKSEDVVEKGSVRKLEEERTQLQKELNEEQERNAKLEADFKLLGELLTAAKAESNKHRQSAVILAKERRWFADKISKMAVIIEQLEESLEEERAKSQKILTKFSEVKAQMKSQSESHVTELLAAEKQYQKSLEEKECKIEELCSEIRRLKTQLLDLQKYGATSATSFDTDNVMTSCSVTLPFPLNSATDVVDSSASGAVKGDTTNVALPLQADLSSAKSMPFAMEGKPPLSVSSLMVTDGSHVVAASSLSGSERAQARILNQLKSGVVTLGLGRGTTGGHSRIPQFLGTSRPSSSSSKPNLVPTSKMDSQNSELPSADWQMTPVSETIQASSKTDEAGAVTNFDIFGPEMANLQLLLVSMATGESSAAEKAENAEQDADHLREVHEDSAASGAVPGAVLSSIHAAILAMDHISLARLVTNHRPDLNEPISNGALPLQIAAENGCKDCVRVLLDHGADPNVLRDDHSTPLHVASTEGHLRCLQLLLEYGGCVSLTDQMSWTPLHCAASNGHSDCCRVLLDHGARIDAVTSANWTPLHCCIHSGHSTCLEAILTHQHSNPGHTGDQILDTLIEDVVNMVDKDGWTIAHLATVRESKDCLEVLSRHIHLDLERRDKWNRSVLDVASVACRQFLQEIGSRQEVACIVSIELTSSVSSETKASPKRPSSGLDQSCVTVGSVVVSKGMTWMELEEKLGSVFLNHTSEVSIGLRTKKTSRLEQDSPDAPNPFTLGISLSSVKYYSIGRYHWSPGTSTEKSPFEMLAGFNTNAIVIKLFGLDDGCQDSWSYETLIPVSVLQNYLRLIDQYRSVVFYGPKGTGKTFLVRKLAKCIQMSESRQGNMSEVTFFTLSAVFSRKDLLKLLLDKGCLINSSSPSPPAATPILILDDLAKISVVEVFKDILPAMETRGPANPILVRNDGGQEMSCYINPKCFIIGTMDRARSTGLELSIQQRFKWVHLRCDQEPIKYLLHRHLLRRLAHSYRGCIPLPDNSIYKAAEWVICVWQRLNEGLAKLGLLDLIFGPCYFLVCPIEANKPKTILRWLNIQWNQVIAPTITEAVIRGSGSDIGGGGQQKVASTALYVLMQRAIVTGCPLSGLEKERYFAGFQGSNELDIKIRGEKRDQKSYSATPPTSTDATQLRTARNVLQEGAATDQLETKVSGGFLADEETRSATIRKKVDEDVVVRVAVTKDFSSSFSNSSLFAVSGIPTRPSIGQPSPGDGNPSISALGKPLSHVERHSPLPTMVPGNNNSVLSSSSSFASSNSYTVADTNATTTPGLVPHRATVIISQPVRNVTSPSFRSVGDVGSGAKRTFSNASQEVQGCPPEMQRIISSPAGNQWRRAVSPGPEIMHSREVKFDNSLGRSGSPGPDLIQNRLWRSDAVQGGMMTGGNFYRDRNTIRFPLGPQPSAVALGPEGMSRRIDFRVVNPTKVLPIDIASMSMRDSPK